MKVGDKVCWVDRTVCPAAYGKTATVTRDQGDMVEVRWHTNCGMPEGGWLKRRFEPIFQLTPFETRVQEYITSELSR